MGIICLGCRMLTTLCVLHHVASSQLPDITARVTRVPQTSKGVSDKKNDLSISCNLVPPPSEGDTGKWLCFKKFINVSPYKRISFKSLILGYRI